MSIVALIPARSGSKRVPNKNLRIFGEFPLIVHTILPAIQSGIFARIVVSTDSEECAAVARKYGAEIPGLRPESMAKDESPDIEWVSHALSNWITHDEVEFMAILRPTSPFRSAETLIDAYNVIQSNDWADSLRAISKVSEHPAKMWKRTENSRIVPFFPLNIGGVPGHSAPYQSLPEYWVQNASLEMARLSAVIESKTISGTNILGYQMPGIEGFDINTELDFAYANMLLAQYS